MNKYEPTFSGGLLSKKYETKEDAFEATGFHIARSYWSPYDLGGFEDAIIDLYHMQARKIGDYREFVDEVYSSTKTRFEKISALAATFEDNDKEAAYQVQKFFSSSERMRSMFDKRFTDYCASLMGAGKDTMLVDGPALFVNKPGVKRLLYKWHSEANYYPKRRKFVNVWFPVFGNRDTANGTMSFKVGSHKHAWHTSEIVEYSGYNAGDEKKKNQFWQLEIPENFLTGYETFFCNTNRTDVVFFDRNLAHTSNANTSDVASFAIVVRVWNPEDDLTLTGSMEATAYGGNQGRANLVVKP